MRNAARTVAAVLGDVLMTLGALVLLFVVWQLWWTDVAAGSEQRQIVATFEREVASSVTEPGAAPAPDEEQVAEAHALIEGEVFGVIRVPRFGADYARPILSGTDLDILSKGVGHYIGSAMPGEVGNFALAGHRVTWAKPFNQIHTLREGDTIVIETREGWTIYTFDSSRIVLPSQSEVVAPVPGELGAEPDEAWLTMTSCHPMFEAYERYIVHARLVEQHARADGLPPHTLDPPED